MLSSAFGAEKELWVIGFSAAQHGTGGMEHSVGDVIVTEHRGLLLFDLFASIRTVALVMVGSGSCGHVEHAPELGIAVTGGPPPEFHVAALIRLWRDAKRGSDFSAVERFESRVGGDDHAGSQEPSDLRG